MFSIVSASLSHFGACCLLITILAAIGCGTNQFQQELKTEEAAIKLVHETLRGKYELISTAELKQLLDTDEKVVLVDAMPPGESFDKAHIPGAVNFEFPKEVMQAWDTTIMGGRPLTDFEKLLGADKERKIVVYCGFVACARSHNAALFAKELGYSKVYRYPGGIYAWRGAGLPVATGGNPSAGRADRPAP
jgi:rhodanese-related sulfurtransferase